MPVLDLATSFYAQKVTESAKALNVKLLVEITLEVVYGF